MEQLTERWHGTLGGYNNYRCRCPRCRAANMAYRLGYIERAVLKRLEGRAAEMAKLRENGCTLQCIASRYGISRQRVHQILRRARNGRLTTAAL